MASLELAVDTGLVGDVSVFNVLLGYGTATFSQLALGEVGHERTGHADGIHTLVLVKAVILDDHKSLLHPIRDLVFFEKHAVFSGMEYGDDVGDRAGIVDDGVVGGAVLFFLVQGGRVSLTEFQAREIAGDAASSTSSVMAITVRARGKFPRRALLWRLL